MRTLLAALALGLKALALEAAPAAAPLIIIDPGHGGADLGASAEGLNEAEAVLEIAQLLQKALKASGLDSQLTRNDNSARSLAERVAQANVSRAKAFVSLHLNHSPSPSAHGARVFIPREVAGAPKEEPLRWDSASAARAAEARGLALKVAEALSSSATQKVSVQTLNLGTFKGLSLPGMVVELGFISHAETLERLKDPEYRKALASKLATAIAPWARAAAAGGQP